MNEEKLSGTSDNESLLEDTPLHNPENDLLGRNNFSKALAQAILNMEAENGFVFALFGSWGSGKTTTLNFVLHHVNELSSESEKPIVVRFNPWWFSGQEQLILQFFGQLRTALSKPDVPKRLQAISSKLQLFSIALTPLAYIPVANQVANPLQKLIGSLAETMGTIGKQAQLDVTGIRKEIDKALKEQPKKILVVIDDIDRLTAEEIRLMFRLIKAVADFPQTIYLLAFDRDVVLNALQEFQPTSEESYLEKIVQAPFDLPPPDRTALQRSLFTQLNTLLSGTPDELWNEIEWGNIYWDAIDHFIRNPRDIKRLINVLRSSYSIVKGEVNFVDFVAIETLRVFVPKMYGIVQANPDLFLSSKDFTNTNSRDELQKILKQYLQDLSSEWTRNPTQTLLLRLFPRYATIFGGNHFGDEWEAVWRRNLRICSQAVFPVYFRLSFQEGAVTAAMMRALIALAPDGQALSSELLRLTEERGPDGLTSQAREVLERMQDYTQDGISTEHILSVLQALYDVGDELIEARDRFGMFDRENEGRISGITYQLLQRLPDQLARFEILRNLISQAKSISILAHQIVDYGQEHGKYGDSTKYDNRQTINLDQLNELEAIFLQRVQQAAQDGQLNNTPSLNVILSLWERLAGSDEPIRQFVHQLIASDVGFVNLLRGFMTQAFSAGMTDRVAQGRWMIHILQIRKWADPSTLKDRALSLLKDQPNWLTGKQKLALEVFLDTLENAPRGYDALGRPIKEKE